MELPINQIICGDCIEVMRDWPDKCCDLILTDPPYGINILNSDGTMGGTSASIKKWAGQINPKYQHFTGDDKPIDPTEICRISNNQIIWGGNYIADKLPPSKCWLVWYKRINGQQNDYADCELAWTSFNKPTRVFQHLWMGMLRHSELQQHHHPTQKPVALGLWILENYSKPDDIILDCYCGSGSFCVAAKMLGRKFIGIDISQTYVDIANERLAAVDTGVPVKETRKGQKGLFEVIK